MISPGARLGAQPGLPRSVAGIAQEQELMGLVPQARRLGDRRLPLGDQQIEDGRLVAGRHRRQRRRLAPDQQRHRVRVEAIVLVGAARPPPPPTVQRGLTS